ncbi:hypothetical protein BH11ACT6_BH11ACT6_46990 [soil metagenome]
MEEVFIGSEALAAGLVTPYQLRAHHRREFPDVYGPKGGPVTVHSRARGAFLWSKRRAVITGVAASALHGARWVDDGVTVEINYPNNKAPNGVLSRHETLHDDEVQTLAALSVTTVTRTAFDLARRGTKDEVRKKAVARLDALANATRFEIDDVAALASRHPNLSGVRLISEVLDLVDAGAQSPKETWLRLLLVEAGFPCPRTQIPVLGRNGRPRYYLDMGWEAVMVAVEYDGEHHRKERATYTNDIERSEYLRDVGWLVIRVVADNRPAEIIHRTSRAWASRQTSVRP